MFIIPLTAYNYNKCRLKSKLINKSFYYFPKKTIYFCTSNFKSTLLIYIGHAEIRIKLSRRKSMVPLNFKSICDVFKFLRPVCGNEAY